MSVLALFKDGPLENLCGGGGGGGAVKKKKSPNVKIN